MNLSKPSPELETHLRCATPAPFRATVNAVLAHPLMQRMKRISQLGSVALLREGQGHTRWEHSLSTALLAIRAGRVCAAQRPTQVTPRHVALVGLGGLLHDIGHGPFSHVFENEFCRPRGLCSHEQRSQWLTSQILRDLDAKDVAWVRHVIDPSTEPCPEAEVGFLGDIVNNRFHLIDVDKLDYLKRDAEGAGVAALAAYDAEAMIDNSRIVRGRWHVGTAAEISTIAMLRFYMHVTVYSSPTALSVNSAVREVLSAIDTDGVAAGIVRVRPLDAVRDAEAFAELDDTLIQRLYAYSGDARALRQARRRLETCLRAPVGDMDAFGPTVWAIAQSGHAPAGLIARPHSAFEDNDEDCSDGEESEEQEEEEEPPPRRRKRR